MLTKTLDQCSTWKTALAFTFISALLWLATALLAIWVVHRTGRSSKSTTDLFSATEEEANVGLQGIEGDGTAPTIKQERANGR
jgi:hypothetical protein